jgi:MFS transporter, DHA1 family, multidrug resistance protein
VVLASVGGALAAGVLVTMAATGAGGMWGVAVPLWAVLFGIGFVLPNTPVLALARHGHSAGTAASLLGAAQFGVGALVSPLVGVLGNDARAMSVIVAGGVALSAIVLLLVARPWTLGPIDISGVGSQHVG